MTEFNDGFFWRRTFWLIQGPENSYQVQFPQNLMNGLGKSSNILILSIKILHLSHFKHNKNFAHRRGPRHFQELIKSWIDIRNQKKK